MPVIVIHHEKIGLCVDIEIDEPYIGSTGEPIHFQNCGDEVRDKFFLDNLWVVIRFAEIQIAKYPDECCELIRSVLLDYLTNARDENPVIKTSNSLPQVPKWSREESYRMAFTRFRNSYLGVELREKLGLEKNEYIYINEFKCFEVRQTQPQNKPNTATWSDALTDNDADDLPF